jgi:hypothetical protein
VIALYNSALQNVGIVQFFLSLRLGQFLYTNYTAAFCVSRERGLNLLSEGNLLPEVVTGPEEVCGWSGGRGLFLSLFK